jgi:hypothetical protein
MMLVMVTSPMVSCLIMPLRLWRFGFRLRPDAPA